ncbi:MAG: tetratricopeptide repeat protein, partial [Pirellulaceae bacterium]
IDFGVAKAMGQQLTDQSLLTGLDRMVGTPLYMSPEQAGLSSVDVDTRSDVYSLGVLLYELLTGHTPFERDALRAAGVDEMRRIIREVDPPRPSARVSTLEAAELSTISDRRHVEPRKLSKQLRGDLDWIVMKALDKDRTRRYESASALAADVQRYLDNEPVRARPPSLVHHVVKWTRRHRPLVWSTAVVLMVSALAGETLLWTGYRRAARLERDAGEHLAAATAFLGSGNYTAADRELADARGHLEAAGNDAGPLAENVTSLTAAIAAKTQAIADFEQFQNLRHRIHSEMYALDRDILDQAQEHCRTALDLFGVLQADAWEMQADFKNLSTAQRAILDEGTVELVFIWARLQMGQSDGQPTPQRAAGYRQAIEALGKLEQSHPNIPAIALWIADCWEVIGDQQASAEARARAESMHPTSAADHYLLGEYHAQHGRQDQALASYWQTLAQRPDHYLSLLAAGVALGELQEHQSAEAMLTGAIAMNSQTVIAYVKRAAARSAQSKIVLAQADIEKAQKLDPELARALLRRAGEYRANYQFDKALADYSEAVRLDPTTAAYAGRSDILILQGDLDKALADCSECIRLERGSASAYCTRAEIYRLKGDFVRALSDANESIRIDPKYAYAFLIRGRIHGHQHEPNKALADLSEAIQLDPKCGGYLSGRAEIYLELGDREKAIADFQESIHLDPKHVWGYIGLAGCYRDKGDLDNALAAGNEAVRIAPEYSLAYTSRAAVHNAKRDFEKALADYAEAIRLEPQNANFRVLRSAAWLCVGELEKAFADCQEAIRIDPKYLWAHCNLAVYYRAKGDLDKALAAVDEGVRSDPEYGPAHTLRATIYQAKGDFDKALADYAEAIRLAPQITEAYLCRAAFFRDRGDFAKALADASEAIRIEPGNGEWYERRGYIYLDMCEFDKAAADFDRAVERVPISWPFHQRRARTHFRLKHYDKALESVAKAAELAGDGTNLTMSIPFDVAKCPDEQLRQGLLELADKAIETTKGGAEAYRARAALYVAFARGDDARVDFDKVLQLEPNDAEVWTWWASVQARSALWNELTGALSKLIELEPERADHWYQRCLARLGGGQVDDYRQDCNEMLQRFAQTDKAQDAYWVAWASVLAPDAVADWSTAVALAEKAVQSDPKSAMYLGTLGAVFYRAGRFDEALARLSETGAILQEPSETSDTSPASTWFFLAMTHHRLGQAEDAKLWFDKAVAWTDKIVAQADQGTTNLAWNRRLTLLLLRDEAAALLGVNLPIIESATESAARAEEKPK